jgi:hypothetical protein
VNRQEALDNAAFCAARAEANSLVDPASWAAASRAWSCIAALYPPQGIRIAPWLPGELYERFNAAAGFFNNPEWAQLPADARTGWIAIAALVNNDPASTPIPTPPSPGRVG